MQISKKTRTRAEAGQSDAEKLAALEAENAALQETVDLLTVAILEG